MSDEILKKLIEVIQNRDRINNKLIKAQNVSLGLRDEQGAGIVVGATTKSNVIGHNKKYLAVLNGESADNNQIAVDPEDIYKKIYGSAPTKTQLESFIPKLKTILPYEFEPIEGKLFYCGIDIEEIINAHKKTFGFEEVSYLLLTGELPTTKQLCQTGSYNLFQTGMLRTQAV